MGLPDSLHRASLIFCHFLLPFGLRGALASLFLELVVRATRAEGRVRLYSLLVGGEWVDAGR